MCGIHTYLRQSHKASEINKLSTRWNLNAAICKKKQILPHFAKQKLTDYMRHSQLRGKVPEMERDKWQFYEMEDSYCSSQESG